MRDRESRNTGRRLFAASLEEGLAERRRLTPQIPRSLRSQLDGNRRSSLGVGSGIGGATAPVTRDTSGNKTSPAAAATVLNGHHSGYGISAGIPNSGSHPPRRSTSDTANAAIDPITFAFESNNALKPA